MTIHLYIVTSIGDKILWQSLDHKSSCTDCFCCDKLMMFVLQEILFFFAMFVFTALIPLLTILIPITAASSGSVIDHAGFSLGMMTLLGWSMGMYSLFYFEQFFGSLLPFRCLAMIVIGPLAAGFHILVSVSLGMLLPYGPDMVILFVVFTMAIMFGVCLPKDVRKKAGFYVRLIIGASVLGVSITCIRLLTLMEAAKTRGAQVAYALVLILPVIFTRLTTDVQVNRPTSCFLVCLEKYDDHYSISYLISESLKIFLARGSDCKFFNRQCNEYCLLLDNLSCCSIHSRL